MSRASSDFAFSVSPASHEFVGSRGDRCRRRHHEQVRPAGRGQARLQSDELRAGGNDGRDGTGLGLAGPVGQHGGVRLPPRLHRRSRRQPGRAERRDARLSRQLRRAPRRTVALARRADEHPLASARERRPRALCLLHDLRPEDDARLTGGPPRLCRSGGRRRLDRAVQALPDERAPVVTRVLRVARAPDRPVAPRPPIPLASESRSPPCPEPRSPPERRSP